ncbi:bud site selection protein 20 [Pancytospora epiphaga]|nr:bud site selection protein 20 [Pancytospora epiphaga]
MVRSATRKSKKNHTARKEAKLALKHGGHRSLDLVKESVSKNLSIDNIEDMPAGGKFACLKCDLYFIDEHTLSIHNRTKAHKKRQKEWKEKCHNSKDAERAAGLF